MDSPAEGGLVVVDGLRGRLPGERVATQVWPAGGDDGRAPRPVPAAVDVEPFGAELQRLLAANQRAKQKQIGYPLTLHTYHATNIPEASCTVTCDGNDACSNTTVDCPEHWGCSVSCTDNSACSNLFVECSTDGTCSLTCLSGGGGLCNGSQLLCGMDSCTANCPVNADVNVQCGESCSCVPC